MNSTNPLEPVGYFNRYKRIEASTGSQIIATSQFFTPLDVRHYTDTIKQTDNALISVEIWPCGYCNQHCTFCSFESFAHKSRSALDCQHLLKIIDELADLGNKVVRLSGGGEPLLFKGMHRVLERIAEKGMQSLVITNGSMLDKTLIESLVRYASVVRFSLNAGTAHDYQLVHRTDQFKIVIENMQKLAIKRQTEKREQELLIGTTFVVTPQNFRNLSDAARNAKDSGLDFLIIRGINPVRTCFMDADRSVLYQQLQMAHALKDTRFFVSGSITRLDGLRGKKQLSSTCHVCDYRLFIDSEGKVYPCFSAIMHGTALIGDTHQYGMAKIWHGRARANVRQQLLKDELLPFCQRFCDHVEFNAFVKWVKDLSIQDKDVKFRRVPRIWAASLVPQEFMAWF